MTSRHRPLRVSGLALALALCLLNAGGVRATAPISGNTLDFGAGNQAGTSTASLNAVAAGDLDQDGDLDVATGASLAEDFEIVIWENDGTPFTDAWSQHDVITTTGNVLSLALGDLDGDGDLDIAAGLTNHTATQLVAWENDGTPFVDPWTSSEVGAAGDGVNSLALGDLDRDGDLDLVSGSAPLATAEVRAWQNDGTPFNGVWTGQDVGTSTTAIQAVALGDLNSDGWLDLVTGSLHDDTASEAIAWRNDKTPFNSTWPSGVVGDTSDHVNGLAVGDLDANGVPDIVTGSGSIEVAEFVTWEGDGTPFNGGWTKQDAGPLNSGLLDIELADLDGDGDLDVFAGTDNGGLNKVIAWQNDSDTLFAGLWTQTNISAPDGSIDEVTAADLDADGDADIVSISGLGTGTVTAWENTHVHRNTPFDTDPVGVGATSDPANAVAVGDLDNDGDPDLATAGDSGVIFVWRNDGTPFQGGAWASATVGTSADSVTSLALGDFDGNGLLDIASGSLGAEDFEVIAWENDGSPFNGGWAQHDVGTPEPATAVGVHSLAVVDLDGDGDLDVLAGSEVAATQDELNWYRNDGTPFTGGLWNGITGLGIGIGVGTDTINSIATGDVDLDGDPDVIYGTGAGEDFEIIFLENSGLVGPLWFPVNIGASSPDAGVLAVALGDLDRDGLLDIVTGSGSAEDNELIAWEGDGTPLDGGWVQHDLGASADGLNTLALGDLDADGDLDIVTGSGAGEDNELVTWLNDSTPFDSAWAASDVGAVSDSLLSAALSDLNGDGDLDIVSGAGLAETNEIMAWRNIGGSAGLAVTDTAPDLIGGLEDDALRLVFSHNGIGGDHDLEMNSLGLQFLRDDCTTVLTDAEANALVDVLRVRLDDGDGVFEIGDTQVGEVLTLSLASGTQTIALTDGDTNAQVGAGLSKTYWVTLAPTPNALNQTPDSLCLQMDPDAASLVQAKGSDYSVSMQDTLTATSTGAVGFSYLLTLPVVLK
jgi:hypothetical protein